MGKITNKVINNDTYKELLDLVPEVDKKRVIDTITILNKRFEEYLRTLEEKAKDDAKK